MISRRNKYGVILGLVPRIHDDEAPFTARIQIGAQTSPWILATRTRMTTSGPATEQNATKDKPSERT